MATDYPGEFKDSSNEIRFRGTFSFTGSTPATPGALNQVSPVGTITSGALPTVTLVSGTGAQLSTARDVSAYVTVTNDDSANVATATVAISPDNVTYSTVGVASQVAAVNDAGAVGTIISFRLPAAWYVKVTLVHMTMGDTTYA